MNKKKWMGMSLGLFLVMPFLVGAEEGERTVKMVTSEIRVEAPFKANGVGVNQENLWVRVGDGEWIFGEDLILGEGISEMEWSWCDPEKTEPKNCAENAGKEIEITWIDTNPDKWAGLKNWMAGYRRIIQQIGDDGFGSSGFRILSRNEWGADESWTQAWRFASENVALQSLDRNQRRLRQQKMWWEPENQIPEKIVIHHTATSGWLSDPKAGMRAIYLWHAKEKGWGDIGYHFVIGQDGSVMEGRKGGENVIGGHVRGFNLGSIGIAVLGNYQNENVPARVKTSLEKLVNLEAGKLGIDVKGRSEWKGISGMPNLLGHQDLNNTLCPGKNLMREVVSLRGGMEWKRVDVELPEDDKADQNGSDENEVVKEEKKEVVVNDLEFEVVSGDEGIFGKVGEVVWVNLVLKNVGSGNWDGEMFLKATQSWKDGVFRFESQVNRMGRVAKMSQKNVAETSNGLFRFGVRLMKRGESVIRIFPVWEGMQPAKPVEIEVRVE